ncbi:hypothetical protein RND71_024663 [Anisodus tanguticus]|uniref:Uncharacterized protein n=1 Tax=Anisodus tanguticus TaxID=243964 RepID=A0AAE1RQW6_9SOLA|nr:hypothetical protein RND71_024663 [Anisodus tanguticus]
MSGNEQNQDALQQELKGKKLSSETLKRYDSLDLESSRFPQAKKALEWSVILNLAFQSIGVVYGDIGTSPFSVNLSSLNEEEMAREIRNLCLPPRLRQSLK